MKRRFFTVLTIALLSFAALPPLAQTRAENATWADALGAQIESEWQAPEYRAFDFWIGEWEMNWRPRSDGALAHDAEGSWTRQRVFPALGGKALIELAWARDNPEQAGQRGFSIRYFDPVRDKWVMAQNWPNQSSNGSAFVDQLIGREHLGRLTMYSATRRANPDGTFQPEHRRYNFADIRPGMSFRWDGSNTPDRGANWYTWYVVDAHRHRDLDPYGAAGTPFPGVHEHSLCTQPPHGSFNPLQGNWAGTVSDADGQTSQAAMAAGILLDGCAVAAVLSTNTRRIFTTLAYSDRFERWISYQLDDRPGTAHSYLLSPTAGEDAVFEAAPGLSIVDELTPYSQEESLNTDQALHRRIWQTIAQDRIEFFDEIRTTPSDHWTVSAEYRLQRK